MTRATSVAEPSSIVTVDLEEPLPRLGGRAEEFGDVTQLLLVVRLCGQLLGTISTPLAKASTPEALASLLAANFSSAVTELTTNHRLAITEITTAGVPHSDCPYRNRMAEVSADGPGVSVIVCTRDRPDQLSRMLASLRHVVHRRLEVIVVDNAPSSDATKKLCDDFDGLRWRYVLEPRAGLSRARNRGIAEATQDILAFVDDDERVDPLWVTSLAECFASESEVGAVSGLVLPAELRTQAQVQFEQFGGHSKGRGFQPQVFDRDYLREIQSPLYPLPPFGVGANMAFRMQALREIGGFDTALGAGTATFGAEDTHAFSEVLLRGWTMVYCPSAITWHFHRDSRDELRHQLSSYGIGLGAYYTALVLRDPRRIVPLLRLAPRALNDVLRKDSARNQGLESLPADIASASLRGIAKGPLAYAKERRASRRG